MIEAKDKGNIYYLVWCVKWQWGYQPIPTLPSSIEQAVFHLYKLYNLFPVNEDVYYVNKEEETKHTKRSKKGQVKVKAEVSVETTAVDEGDVVKKVRKTKKTAAIVDTNEDSVPEGTHAKRVKRAKVNVKTRTEDDVLLPVNGNDTQSVKRKKGSKKQIVTEKATQSAPRRSNRITSKTL